MLLFRAECPLRWSGCNRKFGWLRELVVVVDHAAQTQSRRFS